MRPLAAVVALIALLGGCDLVGGASGGQANASLRSSAGGEVTLSDGGSLHFAITSEKYKQWDAARQGITRGIAARFGALLQPQVPTTRSIALAADYLESQPGARRSIENAGMSVREFVVMTVALEQEMRLASNQVATAPPTDSMPYEFPPIDTTFIAPEPITPVVPETIPVDSIIRVDTFTPLPARDSSPRTPTVFRRDTLGALPRRDTLLSPPRRDTLSPVPKRDSVLRPAPLVPKPVTPDTIRDTLGVSLTLSLPSR
jgi:hypothetical protein